MKIFGLSSHTTGNLHSVSAQIEWEDCARPNIEVFFRTRGGENVIDASTYNGFLAAAVIPALYFEERRIQIDGEVCPWLVDNLVSVMAYLSRWYWYDNPGGRLGETVKIEAKSYTKEARVRERRVGLFFSGGVDSLYSLRKNLLAMPEGHSGRIRDAVFVYGFDLHDRPRFGTQEDTFEYLVTEFEPALQKLNVNLIPVWTNARFLGPDDPKFFIERSHGAVLGAVAHAISGKLTDCLVASSFQIGAFHPWGSHPLIDSRMSSLDVRLHHDGERTSRIEKIKFLSDWQVARDTLRVCFRGAPGTLNCGSCKKCVRTKLELLCASSLDRTTVFRNGEIGIRLVAKNLSFSAGTLPFCYDLVPALAKAGHRDLAAMVALKGLLCYPTMIANLNVRGVIAGIDKTFCRGLLKRSYRRIKRSRRTSASS